MAQFTVTYDLVTPESAEHGDTAESGFLLPGEWKASAADDPRMTLREAMALASPQQDSGNWWTECEGRQNYQTGAIETRSIHPPHNITASSYQRVTRLLGMK